jgi:hypothetical protein
MPEPFREFIITVKLAIALSAMAPDGVLDEDHSFGREPLTIS